MTLMKCIATPYHLTVKKAELEERGKQHMSKKEKDAHDEEVRAHEAEMAKYGHHPMTPEEEAALLADRAACAAEHQINHTKILAKTALGATDAVAFRCMKAGVSFPKEWQDYCEQLRSIVNTGAGPLPDQPPYPEGT